MGALPVCVLIKNISEHIGEGSKAGGQKPVRQKSVSQKPRYQNPLCTKSGETNADMTQNPADDNCRLVQNPGIQMPV